MASSRFQRRSGRAPFAHQVVAAAVVAGVLSGAPSTVHALVTGRPVLGAARAAGEVLGRSGLARGLAAHAGLSLAWAGVLAAVLPRRRRVLGGALAGLAIAGLDLTVAERRFPDIAALPRLPQVLDHVAFGALVGAVLHASDQD